MTATFPGLRCVLFDLDGTLVDSAPDLGYAANCVRDEAGLPALPLQDYRHNASNGARGLLGQALGLTPEDARYAAARSSFLAHYRANLTRHSSPFPGIPQLLLQLELSGLQWGIATNKAGWLARPLAQALGFSARAACLVAADEVPRPKPAPDMLHLALQRLQLSSEQVIYVGDDRRDIDAARAANIKSVIAGWGYLGESDPVSGWGASATAQSPAALAAMVSTEALVDS